MQIINFHTAGNLRTYYSIDKYMRFLEKVLINTQDVYNKEESRIEQYHCQFKCLPIQMQLLHTSQSYIKRHVSCINSPKVIAYVQPHFKTLPTLHP